jgi:beta-glucosidase
MDAKTVVSKLSIAEKLSLLIGKDTWNTVSIESKGIPSISVSDGPHGLRKEITAENGQTITEEAVCFPTASAMAATWNTELVRKTGQALGEECGAKGVDILLGPGTNIKRTPLCGRNFEYFSEDPLLAGELAAAYIEGVQSMGVGTSVKHFAANNQEYDRFQISSEVDIRALREIYFKPFEIAVKKAKPWTVMCAYNRLNGIYCSENRFILNDILREEWGFDGFVVSDWGAVHDRVKSLQATLELQMPYCKEDLDALKQAYENGTITDEQIDAAVERLLNIVFMACDNRKSRAKKYNPDIHHNLAKEVALEAITLLKNEADILPIKKEKVKSIAVLGSYAKTFPIQGGGSSQVNPIKQENCFDQMMELTGSDFEIKYGVLYQSWQHVHVIREMNEAMELAGNSDLTIIFAGPPLNAEREEYDRDNIALPPHIEDAILKIAAKNPNTVVVVQAGSAIDMSSWIDNVKGVVFSWFSGQAGGSALAEILFGLSNPCGKIAETFPLRIEDTPAYATYPGNGYASWYAEGIMVGYRYYDTYNRKVLFPFGHGLSYTSFEYADLIIAPDVATEAETVTVRFKIKNTGSLQGKEVIQLYVKDSDCKVLRPDKELKAFAKIHLKPGEEKQVRFELAKDAFSYFNTSLNAWHIESGRFEILVGSSSRDIRLKGNLFIKASVDYS